MRPQQRTETVRGLSGFASNLYSRLAARNGGNLFLSPYSISSALSLAYLGAREETKRQMEETLGFRMSAAETALTLHDLGRGLASEDDRIKARIANAAWVQDGLGLDEAYESMLKTVGEALKRVDYKSASEAARKDINEWAEEATENLIRNLIPEGVLDRMTRLVLANAVYFKGEWSSRFSEENTEARVFRNLDGSLSRPPTMFQPRVDGFYKRGPGYEAAQIAYGDGSVSFGVVLPEDLDGFEKGMASEPSVDHALSGMEKARINLSMPKFKADGEFFLGAELGGMGMPLAFSDRADFSGITGEEPLKISEVVHKAVVEVSEEGTEAAAATAVVAKRCLSMPIEPVVVDLKLDRPFIYAIRDRFGTPLFIGRTAKL